jgi:glycosyltransferase involved in cell wall biosynthesis
MEATPHIHASAILPVLLHPGFVSADIVHMHCINGGYFSYLLLPFLAVKPLVWTIHDTLAVTANCLNAQYCSKWKTDDCCECPLDGGAKRADGVDRRQLLQRTKDNIMQLARFTPVAPSRWIEGMLRDSVFRGQDIRMIHNAVHTDIFCPRNKKEARRMLKLPQDKKIILFAAHGGLKNIFKGGKYLMDVLHLAAKQQQKWFIVEVGAGGVQTEYPIDGVTIPYVQEDKTMALYYAAADVFVSTSLSESFGLTVCEAQACGTPVVAFAVGGIVEIVEHEKSGYLVPMGDITTLYQRLKQVLETPALSERLSRYARSRTEQLFSVTMMGEKYLSLYAELLQKERQGNGG